MKNYWLSREVKEQMHLFDKCSEQTTMELAKQYLRTQKRITSEMELVYDKILREAGTDKALVSDLYKYNRYYDMLNNINNELNKLGIKQNKIMGSNLTNLYNENYKIIGKQLNIATEVSPELVKQAINKYWVGDGLNYSDRIWNNMSALEQKLQNGIVDCLAAGRSHDKLVEELKNSFNVSFNNANRLVRTEMSYVQNQSTMQKYKDAGLDEYMVLSNQADDECLEYNKNVFKLSEAVVGETMPPFHPNCRCTILAVIK